MRFYVLWLLMGVCAYGSSAHEDMPASEADHDTLALEQVSQFVPGDQLEMASDKFTDAGNYHSENSAEGMRADTLIIELGVIVGQMKYDQPLITVQAGEPVVIVFKNNDVMLHNILILEPGAKEKVGMAADKMVSQPDAQKKGFIPVMDEILFSTPLVNPGNAYRLKFNAPEQQGEYPFICTFPGHWRIMQGVMMVE